MLEFFVGSYSLDEFKKYYSTLFDLRDYYVSRTGREPGPMVLGQDEEQHVKRDPNHLIVWVDRGEIVGHCIWHETSTDEMSPGDPRDREDSEYLKQLLGGKKENLVELHELWLRSDHRGKGFGHQFFSFFEDYISERGFDGIVHYTDHEAVVTLCRKRGYTEAFVESSGWFIFALLFSID